MRLSSWGFGLGAATALTAASANVWAADPPAADPPADADIADVEPPDYPPPSTRWMVAGVGLAATAAFYGGALAASYAYPDVPGMTDLRKPFVGPWIGIVHNGCPATEPDCSTALVAVRTVLMALDGVAQAGSLGIILEGLFMPTQVAAAPAAAPPREPSAPPPSTPPTTPSPGNGDKNLFFVPTPMTVGVRGIGLGVVGRF